MNRGITPLSFLTKLASQRAYVLGSTVNGELAIRSGPTANDAPLNFQLAEGSAPLLSVKANFNAQAFFTKMAVAETLNVSSFITDSIGRTFSVKTTPPGETTGVDRNFVFETGDSASGDMVTVLSTKIGRMYAGAISYTMMVSGWRDPNGELWQSNTNIILKAPSAMIYDRYMFTVRQVEFSRDDNKEVAKLSLVLPGVFAGSLPRYYPWNPGHAESFGALFDSLYGEL